MTKPAEDTIAVRIAKVLAERIIAGTIEPGARLRQDHIAEEFETSHVPVREAFRRLEAQGLAISEPRRGVRVASFDLSEVKEVAAMRAALEVLALRHAAPHLTAAILDKADAIRRKRQQAIQLADDFLRAVFLDMFGDPVTNPKGWDVKPLSAGIRSISSGWSASGENRPCSDGEKGVP